MGRVPNTNHKDSLPRNKLKDNARIPTYENPTQINILKYMDKQNTNAIDPYERNPCKGNRRHTAQQNTQRSANLSPPADLKSQDTGIQLYQTPVKSGTAIRDPPHPVLLSTLSPSTFHHFTHLTQHEPAAESDLLNAEEQV